ncbi:hypothetical protein ACFL09_06265, partial [Planctomycetota bacterium]
MVQRRVCVVLSVVALLAASAFGANLATNGSFESGWTGWTPTIPAGTSVGLGGGFGTTDGSNATIWNGANLPGGASITQGGLATTPGTWYDLRFDYGVYQAAHTHQMRATVTGGSALVDRVVTATGPGPSGTQFSPVNFSFQADSGSTQIRFEDQTSLAASSSADSVLDHVVVQPSTPTVLQPGGAGMVGTVNYLSGVISGNGDVAARGGSTTSSIDGAPTSTTWGASTPGGNDGVGYFSGYNGSYSWHENSQNNPPTRPTWFTIDLGEIPGLPNPGTQSYAVAAVNVYSRTDCCIDQSDALLDITDGNGNVNFTDLVFDFNPNRFDTADFGFHGTYAGTVDLKTQISFNELEAIGMGDLFLRPIDTLALDLGPAGNDFVAVEGEATLAGLLEISWTDG